MIERGKEGETHQSLFEGVHASAEEANRSLLFLDDIFLFTKLFEELVGEFLHVGERFVAAPRAHDPPGPAATQPERKLARSGALVRQLAPPTAIRLLLQVGCSNAEQEQYAEQEASKAAIKEHKRKKQK
jgi:hypothetical protein